MNPAEQLYVRAVYRHFQETGNPAPARVAERVLAEAGLHYVKTAMALRTRFGDAIPIDVTYSVVQLPLAALVDVPEAMEDYDTLVRAFPVMLQVYRTRKPEPEMRAADLAEAGWKPQDIMTAGKVLGREYILTAGGGRNTWENWHYLLSPTFLDYADAKTGRQYVDERLKNAKSEQRQANRAFGHRKARRGLYPPKTVGLWAWIKDHVLGSVVAALVVAAILAMIGLAIQK